MKIGIDISQIQYSGTGVSNYTYNLVENLIQLYPQDQVILFGSSFRKFFKLSQIATKLDAAKKSIYPIPPILLELLHNKLHQIPIESFTGDINIFHASDWTQPPSKKAKLITTIHDLTVLKYPEHHHTKTIAVHKRRLSWVTAEADAIIADSQATKQDIINLLQIPADKIHVVYLSADKAITEFAAKPQSEKIELINQVRTHYHLNKPYILSVGTNEPRKNLDRTIKAFLQTDSPHLLVVVGRSGWGSHSSKAYSHRIRHIGFVPYKHLPALYAGADSFVYPSLYEGFGLPVLEAMTLGTPVVTSQQGSLKEVAGHAAVLVDPYSSSSIASGIITSISDSSRLIRLGLKQASKFSWERTARQTHAVYENTYHT